MNVLVIDFLTRLDGQTPVQERQVLIDQFNNDQNIFIFILSTKAGSVKIEILLLFYFLSISLILSDQFGIRIESLKCLKVVLAST